MINIITVSVVLNVFLIILCCYEKSKLIKLHNENITLKKRKVLASEEMIQSIENVMIQAIKTGNFRQYCKYRNMYNDLMPKEVKKGSVK